MTIATQAKPLFVSPDYRQGATQGMGPLPASGQGVTVAVFDSGVRPHADFGDRLLPSMLPDFSLADLKPYFPDTRPEVLAEHLDFYQSQARENPDLFGHGTHAASLIAGDGSLSGGEFRGVAPAAHIQPIQVAVGGPQARGLFFEGVKKGLDWIIKHRDESNIRVANFSIGMPLSQPGAVVETLIDPLQASIRQAVQAGIVVVAAAGNFGPQAGSVIDSPALNPDVITVGGYDPRTDSPLSVSSRGLTPNGHSKPDLLAPAMGLVGATSSHTPMVQEALQALQMQRAAREAPPERLKMLAGLLVQQGVLKPEVLTADIDDLRRLVASRFAAPPMYAVGDDIVYISGVGTSFAAPLVSGVVAAMMELNPTLTPAQVKEILTQTARPLPGVPVQDQGAGVLQADKALARAANARQPSHQETNS